MTDPATPLILIDDWWPGELRAFAFAGREAEPRALVDCLVLRDSRPVLTGAILRGRVTALDRGLKAAFVEAGLERPGFLPLKDRQAVSEGERVLVRVVREPAGRKGPRLVLLNPSELQLSPEGAPGVLRPAAPLLDWLDALSGVARVVAATPVLRRRLGEMRPGLMQAIAAPKDPLNLVDDALEARLAALLQPEMSLPGGGGLRLDALPGMVAVDVDSGGRDGRGGPDALALDCNLAAARTLAAELRLRSLSGLVVADFLALETKTGRRQVEAELTAALENDPAAGRVEPLRASGLLELTRRRLRPSLLEILGAPCGLGGAGWRLSDESEARAALRAALARGLAVPAERVSLTLTADLHRALEGSAAAARRAAEERLGYPLDLRVAPAGASHDLGFSGAGEQAPPPAWRLQSDR